MVIPKSETFEEDCKVCRAHGLPWIAAEQDWASFFTDNPCEEVIISLPHRLYPYLEENLDQISDQVPDVKIIPDVLRYSRFNTGMEMIGQTPVIHVHDSPLTGFNIIIKRLMDISGAMLALTIFAPVMALIALMVPLSSRGPILYRQVRMGLDGKTFHCLKFRSMPVNSEASTGAVWATAADNRATPFGSFLRKTSLDELPQLFNVLKGDMSLVGPRPSALYSSTTFAKKSQAICSDTRSRRGLQVGPRSTAGEVAQASSVESNVISTISKTGLFGWTLRSF